MADHFVSSALELLAHIDSGRASLALPMLRGVLSRGSVGVLDKLATDAAQAMENFEVLQM